MPIIITPAYPRLYQRPRMAPAVLALACALAIASVSADESEQPHPVRVVASVEGRPLPAALLLSGRDFSSGLFSQGGAVQPGRYELDITVNGKWVARRPVELRADSAGTVRPCMLRRDLTSWGLDVDKLDNDAGQGKFATLPVEAELCDDIARYIPDATVQIDVAKLDMQLSVPQLYIRYVARDWVDPSQWDQGVTAAMLRYNLNAYRSEYNGRSRERASLGLDIGLNVGAWRLRHDGYLRWSEDFGREYDSSNTYLQRDIHALQAQLLIGESNSRGDLFSSIGFTGAQLYSDDRMLPASQRGFAPVIRGVANGNSRVTIYQQGRVIRELSVANGPFEIGDLYSSAYGGDLEVVITAADGSTQRFTQSYAAVPQLLRPGQSRFSVAAGQVRSWQGDDEPFLLEGTWRRGISNAWTGYAGARMSEGYGAVLMGAAINLPFGALGADVTSSNAENPLNGKRLRGESYRLTYSKELTTSRTNLSLAAYRYSTEHYRDLNDHIRDGQLLENVNASYYGYRQRSRFDINVSQTLPEGYGSIWISSNNTQYWDRPDDQTSFNLGYSNQWRSLSFGFTAQRTLTGVNDRKREDTQYSLSLSMPLGSGGYRAPRLDTSVNHSDYGTSYRAGVSVAPSQAVHYGLGASHDSYGGTAFDANANYRARYAELNGYYSHSEKNRALSLGMQGGLVLHGGGVTLAQSLGDTIGLVHAPGAEGAIVDNNLIRVDRRGYAVVGNLSPYRLTQLQLDSSQMNDNVTLLSVNNAVAPTLGAVVPVVFRTSRAVGTMMLTVQDDSGRPLNFGSPVVDPQAETIGAVGQGGRIWLTYQQQPQYVIVEEVAQRFRCAIRDPASPTTCEVDTSHPQKTETGATK